MKPRKCNALTLGLLIFGTTILATLVLVSCASGLSPSLQRDIATEKDKLQVAEHQLQRSQEKVSQDVSVAPDLFQGASAPAEWTSKFRSTREKLDLAESDSRELSRFTHRNREDTQVRARRLLAEERSLREAALRESDIIAATADKWLEFRRNLPASLDKMHREHEAIRAVDLGPVSKTVERAGHDWPAKKSALDNRLAALHEIPKTADTQWRALEATLHDAAVDKASGRQLATLIEAEEVLSQQEKTLTAGSDEVSSLSAQLYDAWDKILIDLDTGQYGEDRFYRERLKTVRTHFTDVASKKTETHSDQHWTNISEASFHAVENDLGMAISHKDAGLFDSEAQNTPQPAGFAYVASPSQGSNQYGYWAHSGGESVWTFLPQYLLMRELLWSHDYRPVPMGEYNAYRTAQRNGSSYYGRETPASPPKYGSHGTFTQTHYADSRYVQAGGFKGSAYASRGSTGPQADFRSSHADPHNGSVQNENGGGRRFGRQAGSPGGQRFGRSGGFRPSGRSFGRGR